MGQWPGCLLSLSIAKRTAEDCLLVPSHQEEHLGKLLSYEANRGGLAVLSKVSAAKSGKIAWSQCRRSGPRWLIRWATTLAKKLDMTLSVGCGLSGGVNNINK